MALWKDTERAIARRMGGQRVGNLGKGAPDVLSGWLSIECKSRQSIPSWLKEAVEQSRANCEGKRLPVVILHENGQRHDDDIVIMALKSFETWFTDCQEIG